VDEPAAILVRACSKLGESALRAAAEECVRTILARLPDLQREVLDGRHVLF
jgi:hypothetical protein